MKLETVDYIFVGYSYRSLNCITDIVETIVLIQAELEMNGNFSYLLI